MKNITQFIPPVSAGARPPKLLDQLRRCIRDKHYSMRTEKVYVYWVRWFIRFHGLRHPLEMGAPEVQVFLSYLSNERQVAAATHKQALCALLFLYKNVLQMDLPWMAQLHRPTRPPKRPAVLTPGEVESVFQQMSGTHALIARLLYGTGMRLMECMMLRVKDVDFERREITVRDGKGGKDRMTMLPLMLLVPLREQIGVARGLFDDDRSHQRTGVMLPNALERKYPRAGTQWGWYWVFPSDHESTDPRSGVMRRHHMYEQTVQRAIKSLFRQGESVVAEVISVQNKAWRRVIARYDEEPQRRAGRKAPRDDDLTYWNRLYARCRNCRHCKAGFHSHTTPQLCDAPARSGL